MSAFAISLYFRQTLTKTAIAAARAAVGNDLAVRNHVRCTALTDTQPIRYAAIGDYGGVTFRISKTLIAIGQGTA